MTSSPCRGHSLPCQDFISRVPLDGLQAGNWNCFWFSKTDLRSAACARKSAPQCCALLRWWWLLYHSRFAPCELFGNQDCLHIVASLLGRSLRSLCSRPWLVATRTPCSGTRLSKTYGFLPLVAALRESSLQRGTQGICLCVRQKSFNVRLCAKVLWLPFWVEMQWNFAQRIVAYQHTAAHLRIMHAHLAFCRYLCKFNGALCIYNGALIDLSNFWYIDLQEKKVNRCVLVTNPT